MSQNLNTILDAWVDSVFTNGTTLHAELVQQMTNLKTTLSAAGFDLTPAAPDTDSDGSDTTTDNPEQQPG